MKAPGSRAATAAHSSAAPKPQQDTEGESSAAAEAKVTALQEHAPECSTLGAASGEPDAAQQSSLGELHRPVDVQGSEAAELCEQQGSSREEHTADRCDHSTGGEVTAPHQHELERDQAGTAAAQPPATPVPFIDRMEAGAPRPSDAPRPSGAGAAEGDGCATPEMATPAGASAAQFETPGVFDPMFTPAADLGRPTSARNVCTTARCLLVHHLQVHHKLVSLIVSRGDQVLSKIPCCLWYRSQSAQLCLLQHVRFILSLP